MKTVALALLLGLVWTGTTAAQEYKAGSIQITRPWAPPTPPNLRTGVVYMLVANEGKEIERLLSAASPVAERVEMHINEFEGNIARMRQIPAVEIAPGQQVTFRPGGLHVMLLGLRGPLRRGEPFPLSLTFEKTGTVEIRVAVELSDSTGGDQQPRTGADSACRRFDGQIQLERG